MSTLDKQALELCMHTVDSEARKAAKRGEVVEFRGPDGCTTARFQDYALSTAAAPTIDDARFDERVACAALVLQIEVDATQPAKMQIAKAILSRKA